MVATTNTEPLEAMVISDGDTGDDKLVVQVLLVPEPGNPEGRILDEIAITDLESHSTFSFEYSGTSGIIIRQVTEDENGNVVTETTITYPVVESTTNLGLQWPNTGDSSVVRVSDGEGGHFIISASPIGGLEMRVMLEEDYEHDVSGMLGNNNNDPSDDLPITADTTNATDVIHEHFSLTSTEEHLHSVDENTVFTSVSSGCMVDIASSQVVFENFSIHLDISFTVTWYMKPNAEDASAVAILDLDLGNDHGIQAIYQNGGVRLIVDGGTAETTSVNLNIGSWYVLAILWDDTYSTGNIIVKALEIGSSDESQSASTNTDIRRDDTLAIQSMTVGSVTGDLSIDIDNIKMIRQKLNDDQLRSIMADYNAGELVMAEVLFDECGVSPPEIHFFESAASMEYSDHQVHVMPQTISIVPSINNPDVAAISIHGTTLDYDLGFLELPEFSFDVALTPDNSSANGIILSVVNGQIVVNRTEEGYFVSYTNPITGTTVTSPIAEFRNNTSIRINLGWDSDSSNVSLRLIEPESNTVIDSVTITDVSPNVNLSLGQVSVGTDEGGIELGYILITSTSPDSDQDAADITGGNQVSDVNILNTPNILAVSAFADARPGDIQPTLTVFSPNNTVTVEGTVDVTALEPSTSNIPVDIEQSSASTGSTRTTVATYMTCREIYTSVIVSQCGSAIAETYESIFMLRCERDISVAETYAGETVVASCHAVLVTDPESPTAVASTGSSQTEDSVATFHADSVATFEGGILENQVFVGAMVLSSVEDTNTNDRSTVIAVYESCENIPQPCTTIREVILVENTNTMISIETDGNGNLTVTSTDLAHRPADTTNLPYPYRATVGDVSVYYEDTNSVTLTNTVTGMTTRVTANAVGEIVTQLVIPAGESDHLVVEGMAGDNNPSTNDLNQDIRLPSGQVIHVTDEEFENIQTDETVADYFGNFALSDPYEWEDLDLSDIIENMHSDPTHLTATAGAGTGLSLPAGEHVTLDLEPSQTINVEELTFSMMINPDALTSQPVTLSHLATSEGNITLYIDGAEVYVETVDPSGFPRLTTPRVPVSIGEYSAVTHTYDTEGNLEVSVTDSSGNTVTSSPTTQDVFDGNSFIIQTVSVGDSESTEDMTVTVDELLMLNMALSADDIATVTSTITNPETQPGTVLYGMF